MSLNLCAVRIVLYFNFIAANSGKPVMRLVDILQPTKDLSHVLFASKVRRINVALMVALTLNLTYTGWCGRQKSSSYAE